jgi:hypothetical protein
MIRRAETSASGQVPVDTSMNSDCGTMDDSRTGLSYLSLQTFMITKAYGQIRCTPLSRSISYTFAVNYL